MMSRKYNVPNNLPQNIINKICQPKIEINDDIVLEYLNFLKNKYQEENNATINIMNINEEKNILKKQLIKWRILHYCKVLDNAIKKKHDLIMVNDPKLKIKDKYDYYKNIKVYDSITKEEISINLQPSFNNSKDLYNKMYSVWSIEVFNKIVDCVNEYINFINNVKISLRFKGSKGIVYSYYYDETNNKILHDLRQRDDNTSDRIIGLSNDPRIKASEWYKNFFCKKTLEIKFVGKERFIYKDTKELVPYHLQPYEEYSSMVDDIVYKCIIPTYTDDPRLDAIRRYNGVGGCIIKKDNILKRRNIIFKKKRSTREDKKRSIYNINLF